MSFAPFIRVRHAPLIAKHRTITRSVVVGAWRYTVTAYAPEGVDLHLDLTQRQYRRGFLRRMFGLRARVETRIEPRFFETTHGQPLKPHHGVIIHHERSRAK